MEITHLILQGGPLLVINVVITPINGLSGWGNKIVASRLHAKTLIIAGASARKRSTAVVLLTPSQWKDSAWGLVGSPLEPSETIGKRRVFCFKAREFPKSTGHPNAPSSLVVNRCVFVEGSKYLLSSCGTCV